MSEPQTTIAFPDIPPVVLEPTRISSLDQPPQPNWETPPDAPTTTVIELIRRTVSGVLMLLVAAVVALLLIAPLFPPLRSHLPWLTSERDRARVRIIAHRLEGLSVSFDGQLDSFETMLNGDRVHEGQKLGIVSGTSVSERLTALEATRKELSVQGLHLESQRGQVGAADQDLTAALDREDRDTARRFREVCAEIEQLRRTEKQLTLVSPVDGRIHFGLAGKRAVKAHEPILFIYPNDGPLLIEVEAPESVVEQILRTNILEAEFSTADGPVRVSAMPIHGTRRGFTVDRGGNTELWSAVQCEPRLIPSQIRFPGPVGRLR